MLFPIDVAKCFLYVFFKTETKQNKTKRLRKKRKKYHAAGVEPETFDV